jgi:ubiquinone/menaquinone biosynthesis C-methylase UbiE
MTDQDRIWEYFQSNSKESFEGSIGRARFLVRLIRSGDKVLNIGIGAGIFERLAREKGIDVYSLDPDSATVATINQKYGSRDMARTGSADAIPFEDSEFDAVVMSEVIEHIPADKLESSLHEVSRVLRKNGRLLGTVPAKENLRKNTIVCPSCGHQFHRWGHAQSYDLMKMRRTLESLFGIEVLEQRFFPSWSTMNWKGRLENGILLVLHKLGVELANENILFVASKRLM